MGQSDRTVEPTESLRRAAAAVRRTRENRALSQEELAERSGVSIRTLRSLERAATGAPRRETLLRIASALDLDPVLTGRLLSAWGYRDTPEKGTFAFGEVPFLDEMRRVAAATSVLHRDQTVEVDRRRIRVRQVTRVTMKVRRETVSEVYVAVEPDLVRADVEIVDLDGCELTADETAANGVRVLRFALDIPGSEHEIIRFGYTQRLRSGYAVAPPVDHAGAGFHSGAGLFTMHVRFDPRTLPSAVHQCTQDHPFGDRRAIRPLTVTRGGGAFLAVERPRPGAHLVSWKW